jgi:hypothetical protein
MTEAEAYPRGRVVGGGEDKKTRLRISVTVEVARVLYCERTPCAPAWTDVHLPSGPRFSHRRVPMPLVPHKGQERRQQISRRRALLPPYLLADLVFGFESPMWDLATSNGI